MDNKQLERLYKLYLNGQASPVEKQELMLLWNDPANEAQIKALMDEYYDSHIIEYLQPAHRAESIFQDITGTLQEDKVAPPVHRIHFLKTAWFRYAAAIVGVLAIGAYLWLQNSGEQTLTTNNKQVPVDIKPGNDGAILTLADGSQLVIDSLQDGIIAQQNGSKVLLLDGKMTYSPEGKSTADMVYNTISTPKGKQFQFTLPDGTNVWLNAGSSIRYPTLFAGKDRRVEVKGELYFDVSKNAQKPFIVETDDMTVEVLGTEFNINCYDNEAYAQTTLVNGLVKLMAVKFAVPSKLLYPGKHATISKAGKDADPIKITDAENLDQVIAWKDGLFNFNKVDLFNLMRQLERWYNIEVEYKGDVENIKFRGKMYRNVNLSDVIKELEKMDLSIKQEGNKLMVQSAKSK